MESLQVLSLLIEVVAYQNLADIRFTRAQASGREYIKGPSKITLL